MRHYLLSRVFAQITDFGQRSLSFTDFYRECDHRGIGVYHLPLQVLHGGSWSEDGQTHICLNSNLPFDQRLQTAWHELGHVLLHPIERSLLASRSQFSNVHRWEAEANAVAAIAIIPVIPAYHDVLTNLEWLRLQLFQKYGV